MLLKASIFFIFLAEAVTSVSEINDNLNCAVQAVRSVF